MSFNPLEAAVAALNDQPPAARLEPIWTAYETDQGRTVARPPSDAERFKVAEWLRLRRRDDHDAFVVRDSRLRWLAHRTPAEKANTLAQTACPACEVVVDGEGRTRLHLVTPINIDPWSAQSSTAKVAIRQAVHDEMIKKSLHEPLREESLCVTVVSFLPKSRHMDVDNLVKGLLDGMEEVLYVNDQQIQCMTSRRINTDATNGAYLLSARVVHPYEADVVCDDARPLDIRSGPRITPA
jgi:hypothetical protein